MNPQSVGYPVAQVLYIAFELAAEKWRLAMSTGGTKVLQTVIPAGDAGELKKRIDRARRKLDLPESVPVVSCYEAGRDGFWVHRLLEQQGLDNVVVDAASIQVDRRKRRAKNDRIDARLLLAALIRHHRGDREVWRVVRVPTPEQEDARRLHRDLERLKKEKSQHLTRIRSTLATEGIRPKNVSKFLRDLDEAGTWEGKPLPSGMRGMVERERERLALIGQQIRAIEKEQRRQLEEERSRPDLAKVERLMMLRGIGMDSAWLLVMELFGWREFSNRREVGGIVGLVGTPYSSGATEREQGISKAGNPRVRTRMVELSWQWLRYQPQSDLSQWFLRRFADGPSRMRRVGVVAMARRLIIDLWHFVEHGVVPKRVVLKQIPVVTR